MVDLVYFITITFIFILFSQKVVELFKINFSSYLENIILSYAISLIFIAYFTFSIGIFGLLYKSVAFAILFFLSPFIYKETKTFFISIFEKYKKFKESKRDYIIVSLWIIFIFCGICNLLLSLSPSIYWDELHYHLTVADIFVKNHKIVYIPYFYYSNFPLFSEMLFTYGMLIQSDILANLFHFSAGIMTSLTIYLICRKYFGHFVGILSCVIFYTMPTIGWLSSISYVDLFFTFYVSLIVHLLLRGMEEKEEKNNVYIIFCGMFCGILLSIKYSGFIFLFLFSLWILSLRKNIIKNLFIFFLFSLIFSLPFYMKNFIFTGNPVYPFFYNIFGGKDIDLETSNMIFKGITEFTGETKNLKNFTLLPFNITFHGERFAGIITPLYLTFLPFLIFIKGVDRNIKYLLFFGILYLPLWFFSSQQIRFLLPSLVCFAIVAGWIIHKFKILGKVWYFIFAFAFVSFILNSIYLVYLGHKRFAVSLNITSKDKFLHEYFDNYSVFQFANKYLPKSSKIFFLSDNRVYYLNRDFIIGYNHNFFKFKDTHNAQERYKKIKSEGIDFLFLNRRFSSCELNKLLFSDAEKGYIDLVYYKNEVYLFLINYNKIYE